MGVEDGAGFVVTRADVGCLRWQADTDWKRAGIRRTVTQLAVPVSPPAVDRTGGGERARIAAGIAGGIIGCEDFLNAAQV